MQRLVAILILAGLLLQQSACCCGSIFALDCTEPTDEHACSDHGHSSDCDGSGEQQAPHEHHICVGSHVFFLLDHHSPALDEGSAIVAPAILPPVATVVGRPTLVSHFRYLAHRPATPALPLRAALQIFVI